MIKPTVVSVPTVYDPEEAAAMLRCRPSWLKEKARRREIPFTMIGGSYRWTAAHLAEIVRLGEQEASEPLRRSTRQVAAIAPDESAPRLRARPPRRARAPSARGG